MNICDFLCQFLDVSGFKSEFLIQHQQKHLKILLVEVILLFKDKKEKYCAIAEFIALFI